MNKDVDATTLVNPYNFSNPIKDEALFFGRTKQLRDIRYYLDQAAASGHPINLALLGERASGKTSYLNIIEKEALRRKFCTARIDLNERDVAQPGEFFAKLIDQLFTAACLTERADGTGQCFGGPAGPVFQEYLNIVGYASEALKPEILPLFTPLLAAKQRQNAGIANLIPEALLKRDLEAIRTEVNRPIVLLFDECDVLTANRVVLQIVRNVFMALDGYLLVFAGTPQLFPLMDDVFSPVVRQFKRFDVAPFDDPEGTKQCVVETLRSLGSDAVKQYLGQSHFIYDIHTMTGGKPYEIQLVCHFMFKNVQCGLAKRMELNVDVIEDVLQELDVRHQLGYRRLISLVKSLSIDDLDALRILFGAEGYATAEEMYCVEEIVFGRPELSISQLLDKVAHFKEFGLLKKGERIVFEGDELDRLYVRYFARAVGLMFPPVALPLPEFASLTLLKALAKSHRLRAIGWGVSENLPDRADNLESIIRFLCGGEPPCEIESIPSDDVLEAWDTAYWFLGRDGDAVDILRLNIHGAGFDVDSLWYGWVDLRIKEIPGVKEGVSAIVDRAIAAGARASARFETIPIATRDVLLSRALQLPETSRRKIAESQEAEMVQCYLNGDREDAMMNALLAYRMDESYTTASQGYVALVSGDLSLAEAMLNKAVQNTRHRTLAMYDLAIMRLMQDNTDVAESLLMTVLAQDDIERDAPYVRLLIARVDGAAFTFEERTNVSLSESCAESLSAITRRRGHASESAC